MRGPSVLICAALVVGPGVPAGATVPVASDLHLLDTADRVAQAERLIASGRLADAVRAGAALGGLSPGTAPRAAPAVGAPLPSGLAPTVRSLLDAVLKAGRLARASVRGSEVEVGSLQRRATAVMRGGPGTGAAARRLEHEVEAVVDRGRIASAMLVLAEAVDRSLPRLAEARIDTGRESAPCEVADEPPLLCISGEGADTHVADYNLTIELGGDDVYRNSAGGADPDRNGRDVTVVIDLQGDDRYETTLPTATGSWVAQGSGYVGGVGMLVDAAGDDTYAARSERAGQEAYGQGVGLLGGGMLADLAGSDTYLVESTAPYDPTPNEFQISGGQAYSGLGGMGLLVDQGAGNDGYTVRQQLVPTQDLEGKLAPGTSDARGIGSAAVGGVSLFSDGGGADAMLLEAIAGPIPSDETGPIGVGVAETWGLGYAGAGSALVLAGDGPTTWTARAEVVAPDTGGAGVARAAGANVLGTAAVGGIAALHDRGGDDEFTASVRSLAVRTGSVAEGCGCTGLEEEANAGDAEALAMGNGAVGGVGMLTDSAGADRYDLTVESAAVAEAHDQRTGVPAPSVGARAVAAAGLAKSFSLGSGLTGGAGLLHDLGGSDLYRTTANSDARATATTTSPGVLAYGDASTAGAITQAQAAGGQGGYGELHDAGGSDRYESTSLSTATAVPPIEEREGAIDSSVQASVFQGGARLLDLDGGAPDAFVATPADPACNGTRGQGPWRDCGLGAGVGLTA